MAFSQADGVDEVLKWERVCKVLGRVVKVNLGVWKIPQLSCGRHMISKILKNIPYISELSFSTKTFKKWVEEPQQRKSLNPSANLLI